MRRFQDPAPKTQWLLGAGTSPPRLGLDDQGMGRAFPEVPAAEGEWVQVGVAAGLPGLVRPPSPLPPPAVRSLLSEFAGTVVVAWGCHKQLSPMRGTTNPSLSSVYSHARTRSYPPALTGRDLPAGGRHITTGDAAAAVSVGAARDARRGRTTAGSACRPARQRRQRRHSCWLGRGQVRAAGGSADIP